MENIAHTLVGLSLARAGLDRRTTLATAALVIGSNLPDLDAIALLRGRLAYIEAHRGLSHSLFGAMVMAVAFGLGLWAADRWWISRIRPHWRRARPGPLVALSVLAVLIHLGLDFLNDYGIRLLLPFSSAWYYGDIVFVVDPWFWLLLGSALHAGLPRRRPLEPILWAGWGLLSLPVLLDSIVTMPARALWCLGLLGLGATRVLGARRDFVAKRPKGGGGGRVTPHEPLSHFFVFENPALGQHFDWVWWRRFRRRIGDAVKGLTRGASSAADHEKGGDDPSSRGWVGRPWSSRARVTCRAALTLLVLYFLCTWVLHASAFKKIRADLSALGIHEQVRHVALLPLPADPVHWNLLFEKDGEIVATPVSSWKEPPKRTPRVFEKNLDRPEVVAALSTPLGGTAHRFCRYLFADLRESPSGTIVAFRDARFAIRGRHEFSVFEVPTSATKADGEPRRVEAAAVRPVGDMGPFAMLERGLCGAR